MVSLKILSGKMAGATWTARHFPFWVGRSPSADFQLDEPGIWDKHFEISLHQPDGFVLRSSENAFVCVGSETTRETVLKNGDLIEVGAAKLRFHLTPTKQKTLTTREIATWIGLGLLCVGQVALIYWLAR